MNVGHILIVLDVAAAELLLFCAVWFTLGALDDILTDLYFMAYRSWRWFVHYRHQAPFHSGQLSRPTRPGTIAVFVAAWQETGVIGGMLNHCTQAWAGNDYRLYVGCYTNDPATLADAMRAAAANPAIRLVLNDRRGPTTKADCLNRLWRALQHDERTESFSFKAIALHDAEDIVHRDELRIYDTLIERRALIQLPVVPLHIAGSRWVSGHYCDEFAEAHGKQMVVRETLGVGMPSSGVGCAFSREILGKMAILSTDGPFDAASLTEDYELGLKIAELGGRGMMVRMRDDQGLIIGTRAMFPATLADAVRQKSRWVTGIALAGWDRLGWSSGWRECWMRFHDRRAIFAAVILFAAYIALILEGGLWLASFSGLHTPQPLSPVLQFLLPVNGAILCWRLAVRACFVGRLYGWSEALRSIPRAIISNIVAILAARRALFAYVQFWLGKPLIWEKTNHAFPQQEALSHGA